MQVNDIKADKAVAGDVCTFLPFRIRLSSDKLYRLKLKYLSYKAYFNS
jgi:hypothetical protein